jgi:hypothetical protein
MATAARFKLSPRDHGRIVSFDEFQAADYKLGYHHELIEDPDQPLFRVCRRRTRGWGAFATSGSGGPIPPKSFLTSS